MTDTNPKPTHDALIDHYFDARKIESLLWFAKHELWEPSSNVSALDCREHVSRLVEIAEEMARNLGDSLNALEPQAREEAERYAQFEGLAVIPSIEQKTTQEASNA